MTTDPKQPTIDEFGIRLTPEPRVPDELGPNEAETWRLAWKCGYGAALDDAPLRKQPEAQEAPASEREAFEKYARGRFDSIVRASNGPYVWDDVQDAWHTWQARAALGKQPTQEAPADAKDAVLVRLRRLIRILDAGRDVDGYKGQAALQEAVDAIEAYRTKAARYDYLRSRDLDTISKGGVFAGQVPQNYVLSGVDLDRAIDSALQSHQAS